MPDRFVVLRSEEPRRFLAEVCAALAAEVNESHAWSVADDQLMAVYNTLK